MKTKKRARSMQIEQFHDISANCGWSGAALVFKEYDNGEISKKITIAINDPSDVAYLREQIDKIVASWRDSVGRLS